MANKQAKTHENTERGIIQQPKSKNMHNQLKGG